MFREKRQSDVGGFTGRGVWHTLLWGALVGTIFSFVLTGLQFAVLKALGEPLTPPPLVGVLALVSPFLVGLTTGIVSHLLLARIGWVPRLTWLLLAFLNWVVVPLGTPLIAALLELFLLALFGQKFLASQPRIFAGLFGFVAPIFGFGAWLILARLVVVAVAISPKAGDESIGRRPALAIAGMYFLALFVAASQLPGMGTLMLGGTIGFLGMIGLALFGMSGLVPKNRTPALIVALWFIPVLTLIGLVFVVFWPLFSG